MSHNETINGHADGANANTNGYTNGHAHEHATPNSGQQFDMFKYGNVPIAICGMGMRLPGGIHNDAALYDFLINKKDARSATGTHRYNINAYYSKHNKPGTLNVDHGYWLDDIDLSKFDLSMFNMTPAEVEKLDPQQRLLLEVVREAFENSGETNWKGKNIGCYVGVFGEDWLDLHAKDTHDFGPYQIFGYMDFMLGNRVSYEYDLRGPSMTIKVACSSAGLCLHHALQAIRQGECTSAIVAGTNLIMAPGMTILMSEQFALSPDASSKSFDASANGYARAEGVNALYVKRLDTAIRDGNPIRAIIRSSASNADGKTAGIANPNPESHEAMIRRAYENAGLDFSQTAMVECHGTGTAVGDPLEVGAVANCFGSNGVYIGSVKPNLGHGEGASAITSLMKAVLSLENKTIIPNIKFNTPNPKIPWESAKLTVPVEPTPWPQDRHERMSVNSFGIGGSNVHFILDSAASFGLGAPTSIPRSLTIEKKPGKNLLLFSANHTESLTILVQNYQTYLEKHPEALDNLTYTLAKRREHLRYRSFAIADGVETFQIAQHTKFQVPSQVAFVFTGQGAQWVGMGRQLMLDYPSFLATIKSMDEVLQGLEHAPSWLIEDVLLKSDDKTIIGKAEFSQPICTALQVALVDLLATWQVTPCAVIGHSSGEIAAAYAAGVLNMKEAMITAFYRGYVCKKPELPGGMAAIGMGKTEVTPFLVPGVRIACENSGSSVTLSGDLNLLENVMSTIKERFPNRLVRRLQVEMAYHSHHMRSVGDVYHDLIDKHLVAPKAPKIAFFSSVKPKVLLRASDFGPKYWQDNLENPVLFHSAVKRLLTGTEQCSVHLEIGPHSALAGPLKQIYKESSASIQYTSILARAQNDTECFLKAMGQLHSSGVQITFPEISGGVKVLTNLPTYPWHYEKSYWSETRIMKNWRYREHLPHDLLGLRTLEGSELEPTWRINLRLGDVPWIKDHCVGNDIVFPAAAYVSMAGEAVSQLTGLQDYTVRKVSISTAMVLSIDRTTEIHTSLRRQRLTSTLETDWYEFEIASYNGAAWNRHCSGLVSGGRASIGPSPDTKSYPRRVSSKRWYTAMSRVGLNYGPRFTGLKEITAGITEESAAVTIVDSQGEAESFYSLHPTTLDLVFQSLTVAAYNGEPRTFRALFLPTLIEELYIGAGTAKEIRVNTTASLGKSKTAHASSHGVANGEVVYHLKGLKCTPLDDSGMDKASELTAVQIQWKPDFEFLDASQLMKPKEDFSNEHALLERLYLLCAAECNTALKGAKAVHPHLEKYRNWIDAQLSRAKQPEYPLVEDSAAIIDMDSYKRRSLIQKILQDSQDTTAGPVATAIWRCYDQSRNIFEGRTDPLDLLLQDGILPALYNWTNNFWDYQNFFQLLGHLQPQMKILEIGAGTGGLTAKILDKLKSDFGERLFLKYTFTDVSAGFFVQSKERFKEYDGMEYKVLDVSNDPLEQGFTAGEYDLIIASNVFHATPFLRETLSNVRTLLQPKGQLFLQEICATSKCMGFIMGLLPGWWLGEEDGRVDEPYIMPEEWNKKLREAGFAGCDSVTYDNELPYQVNANIVAKPALQFEYPETVTLLSGLQTHPLALQTERKLIQKGYKVEHCLWGQEPPADQDLVSFIELDNSFFEDISEEDIQQFLKIIESLQQSTLLWLTPAAQIHPENPHAAQVVGLARTIRSELAMSFATLELEDSTSGATDAIVKVLQKVQSCQDEISDLDPDLEFAWSNGEVNVSRFHWIPVANALSQTTRTPDAKVLVMGKRGLLQTLQWTGQNFHELLPEEVQMKMEVGSLNFKDLVVAMGLIGGEDGPLLGCEGSGFITKVGSEVKHLKEGDRAMTIGVYTANFATEVQTLGRLCVKIPDNLSFEDASTMPCVYMTVFRCLFDKANLQKGQSVLIHSAAGGVGIAAINVAKWLGAEIYVTVGTKDKAAFLMEEFGISHERIFNSRDTSFVDGLMKATNNTGVDVVLNSLSGELLHASWQCVAENGTMVEIGKRDMVGRGQLAMDVFEDNRTFVGVDIARLSQVDGPNTTRLLEQVVEMFSKGHITPIHPITAFNAEDAEEAFRYLQRGVHIGKVVIKFANQGKLPLAPTVPNLVLRQDVSYLLVGGLGGLGKSIAAWMVSHGATHLIFMSRSTGKSVEDQEFFQELKIAGCNVQAFSCDVGDAKAVKYAIDQALKPVGGVLQMAMVLHDIGVMDMNLDIWNTAVRPKVQGTWNLHNILPRNLDFFVLFGSSSGLLGYWGQANYASANTFLDSFVQYRQSRGLPASVIDIGPVEDVGFISRTPGVLETMKATSGRMLSEQDFLDCLQLAIARSSPEYATANSLSAMTGYFNASQIANGMECNLPIADPYNTVIWKRDPRMAIYRNIEKVSLDRDGEASDGMLKQFLPSVMIDPSKLDQEVSIDLLAHEIGRRVLNFLIKGEDDVVDTSLTLAAMGVDSLVAIEIRNWWKQNLGVEISVLELLNGGSVQQLGALAARQLKEKYAGKEKDQV